MADLIVDTYKLNQYAQRISAVNRRIERLDRRLDGLYTQVGLQGLFDLIRVDALTDFSWRLARCQAYLQQTAAEFEGAERELGNVDPASFGHGMTGTFSYIPGVILKPHSHITYDPSSPGAIASSWFSDKISGYLDLINGDGTTREKAQGAIGWLSSLRKDISGYKDYAEWLSGDDIKFPSPIKDGFDFIKALDTGNKLIFGTLDYGQGLINGDVESMTEGAGGLLSALKGGISGAMKTDNKLTDFGTGLLLDYGKNMVTNWLDSIQTETEVSEVYWSTFATSALQVFGDTVCNTPSLAIAYQPAKAISGLVGFDLQGAYEKVSDKTGFAAVTDSVGQLKDLIVENSSWETWKSGMGVIGDTISGWFK